MSKALGAPFAKVSLCIRIELALPPFVLAGYAKTFLKGSSAAIELRC